ncbi:MAG: S9 family peptidase [Candidatus Heimdallarchaeota archaeon]|nr:S9 family peptidase [Candidatus Heimdallarchaeota archaeon]
MKIDYPVTERIDHEDNYHGNSVKDPYRYLEDPTDVRNQKFVEENNKLVNNFVDSEDVEYFKQEFAKYYENDEYSVPISRNGRYFYWRKQGSQLQPIIYMRDGLDGDEIEIIDINKLSDDGTTSVMVHSPSPDGKIYAMSLSVHGSDWQKIFIKNLVTGEVLEEMNWVTFPEMSWNKESTGFYYGKYPNQDGLPQEERRRSEKTYFHTIGTSQQNDQLIFDPKNKEEETSSDVSSDGKYLFISVSESTLPENKLYFSDIKSSKEFTPIVDSFDNCSYNVIDTVDSILYIRTSWQAPKNRILTIDLDNPHRKNWREIVPEKEKLMQQVELVDDKLVINYQIDVKHQLEVFDLEGNKIDEIELPTQGALSSYDSYENPLTVNKDNNEIFFGFTSFLYPITVYHYSLEERKLEEFFLSKHEISSSDFEVKQIFYDSKDGAKIPMYVVHKKGIELNGSNPTFLYGYGGYNISIMPEFFPRIIVWLNQGWVYAQANLRGGGEYGKDWHEQAILGNKQNVFDDFISAGEWLIENKYTSTDKLAINGRSNGGLLVGACMLQRPDLFGAAVPQVGVLDMLRYPVQPDAGRFWTKEYGNAAEVEDHFNFLIKFSPYHNVKSGVEYPPTLITAAEGDDRVAPMHSKKFAAALQYHYKGENPIFLRIETKTGHGFGKSTEQKIEDFSIMFAFLKKVLETKN